MESPLNLPEIIFQVGRHLVRWSKSEKPSRTFEFDSKNLIACTNLNHTWRRTLTPMLWMVYEESRYTQRKIPISTLRTLSHHFRYLRLWNTYPEGVINSTRLRELYITADAAKGSTLQVLRSNPDLLSLTLRLSKPNFKTIYPALSTICRLQYLKLADFRFNNDHQLLALLNNNPGLCKIYLWCVGGITGLDGCEPLLHVTRVSMQPEWKSTPGLVQLVKYCPNLEDLDVHVLDRSCPITELTRNLREFCPKLQSLKCSEASGGNAYDSDDNSYDTVLEDDEIINLINVSPRLLRIGINRRTIRLHVAQAILAHADWLETLELGFKQCKKKNVCFVNKVLANCPSLKTLFVGHPSTEEYYLLKLSWFDKLPWNCPLLQDIHLSGFKRSLDCDIFSDDESEPSDSEDPSSDDDEPFHSDHFDLGSASSESNSSDHEPLHSEPFDSDPPDDNWSDHQPLGDDRSESGQPWTRETTLGPPAQADHRAKLARGHQEADILFLQDIESKGWTAEAKHIYKPISQTARMIRDMIFGHVGGSPHIRRIAVDRFEYVRKDRMPRDWDHS